MVPGRCSLAQELLSTRAWSVERQIEWLDAAIALPLETLVGWLRGAAPGMVGATAAVGGDDVQPLAGARAALLAVPEELERRSALARAWAQSLQQLQERVALALADTKSAED